jgi:23S rRNA (guanosine2251-2'-O)-methyltransferase
MENYIFGLRPVLEAVKADKEIDKIMVRNSLGGELATETLTEIRKKEYKFSMYHKRD